MEVQRGRFLVRVRAIAVEVNQREGMGAVR